MEITATKCLHCGHFIPGVEVKSHPCFTLDTEASCVNCRAWISGYLMCEYQALPQAWNAYQAEEEMQVLDQQIRVGE